MSSTKTPIRTNPDVIMDNLRNVPQMVHTAGRLLAMSAEELEQEKAKLERPPLFYAEWIVVAPATAVYLRALADVLDQANVRVAEYTAH